MTRYFDDRLRELAPSDARPVCVPAVKSPATIALILACTVAHRPVLLPSPGLGETALNTLCNQVGCSHIVTATVADNGRPALAARVVPRQGVDVAAPTFPRPSSDVTLLLTTSGSTGVPKVVPLSMGAVDRFLAWASEQFGMGRDTRVLSYAPLNFDLSLLDVWATLRFGGCVVMVDPDRATDPDHLLDLFAAPGIDLVQSVPMFYRLLSEAADRTGRVIENVGHAVFTGDTMPPGLLTRVSELFPRARLYNVFGCTETNNSLIHELDPAHAVPRGRVPVGRPLLGVDAVILDSDGGLIDGPGTGELLVSTPFQTRGYLDAARNDGVFVVHPDGVTPGVYYRTGDVVTRHPDGIMFLEGRNDFHVKIRGVRTNTQEVERVILGHPEVREAAVVAVPDDIAGARLHALVQRETGCDLNSLQLRIHCSKSLPRTAIPRSISIIDVPIPRTATGKPDRNRITAQQTAHL